MKTAQKTLVKGGALHYQPEQDYWKNKYRRLLEELVMLKEKELKRYPNKKKGRI